jgi:secondary thiamine-phosphate synthase enzyme
MKQEMDYLKIETSGRGFHDLTPKIAAFVKKSGLKRGLLTVFVRHTSASLLIQENADRDVMRDIESFFSRLVKDDPALYRHTLEGQDDMPAHIRAALTQTHLSIPVDNRALALGTWQGIFLYEHRYQPHARSIVLHLTGE